MTISFVDAYGMEGEGMDYGMEMMGHEGDPMMEGYGDEGMMDDDYGQDDVSGGTFDFKLARRNGLV